jgi:hypothetical protein
VLCAVKRFGLEVLYSVLGFFDLFGDEIWLYILHGAFGDAQKLA